MHLHHSSHAFRPALSSLEGRAILSHVGHVLPRPAYSTLIHQVRPAIATDPAGITAILNALDGGMGSEWVKLARAEVKNLGAVISGFVSGRLRPIRPPA